MTPLPTAAQITAEGRRAEQPDAAPPVPASAERCLDCDTVPDPAFGGCECQRDVGDLEDKLERALAAGGVK